MIPDFQIHMHPHFGDREIVFCSCGEELVYAVEHDKAKCLKCIQDDEAKEREEEP